MHGKKVIGGALLAATLSFGAPAVTAATAAPPTRTAPSPQCQALRARLARLVHARRVNQGRLAVLQARRTAAVRRHDIRRAHVYDAQIAKLRRTQSALRAQIVPLARRIQVGCGIR